MIAGDSNITNMLLSVLVVSGLNIIPLSLITGRYFDKLLESRNLPKPSADGILPCEAMNRVSTYIIYILFNGPRAPRPGKYKDHYREKIGNFSFRANARPIDYLFIFTEIVGIIALIWLLILIW